jgi:hypothetical protein
VRNTASAAQRCARAAAVGSAAIWLGNIGIRV